MTLSTQTRTPSSSFQSKIAYDLSQWSQLEHLGKALKRNQMSSYRSSLRRARRRGLWLWISRPQLGHLYVHAALLAAISSGLNRIHCSLIQCLSQLSSPRSNLQLVKDLGWKSKLVWTKLHWIIAHIVVTSLVGLSKCQFVGLPTPNSVRYTWMRYDAHPRVL
jgi:hypothetical protein